MIRFLRCRRCGHDWWGQYHRWANCPDCGSEQVVAPPTPRLAPVHTLKPRDASGR